ncbi:hypothetical protein FFWV33_00365 [Flavobacterium faecale]|uniref:Uncharacterized protein n=1 Tax=Flavobacterium faecale TaxID=1355330 RepID=A0A2S1L8K2_9FLAO|nr:DUF6660 family protein [Flavobacterium faecale]AWG20080.1 hypothetical protein FFWV33_00365 [Flavobacterium faecale]
MKIIALLLAFFILALSSQGCCDDDNCEKEGLLTHTEQKQHKDNCDNSCSPFFSCGTCVGFTFPNPTFYLLEQQFTLIETNLVSTFIPQLRSQFNAAIWQPPKIS